MQAGTALWFLLMIGIGAAGGSVFNAAIDREPPLRFIEAYAAAPSAVLGGQLQINFDVQRSDVCQVERVTRWITASDGIDYSIGNYTLSDTTRPGRERYDRLITIPTNMPPGPAAYRIRIQYACNFVQALGWPVVVESPPVNFRAVLPNDGFPSFLTPLPSSKLLAPGRDG